MVKKCIICQKKYKTFAKAHKKSHTSGSRGRGYRKINTVCCSKKCSSVYNRIRKTKGIRGLALVILPSMGNYIKHQL